MEEIPKRGSREWIRKFFKIEEGVPEGKCGGWGSSARIDPETGNRIPIEGVDFMSGTIGTLIDPEKEENSDNT